jgi:membrane protein implicated in regulation of membrane protease activity
MEKEGLDPDDPLQPAGAYLWFIAIEVVGAVVMLLIGGFGAVAWWQAPVVALLVIAVSLRIRRAYRVSKRQDPDVSQRPRS